MSRFTMVAALVVAATLPVRASGPRPTSPTTFKVRVENVSSPETLTTSQGPVPAAVAPVLWVVHTGRQPLFTPGRRDRGLGLESLAEEGNPEALIASLRGAQGISGVGAAMVPAGAMDAGPIAGGQAYEFEVAAVPGAKLTLAMMFGQSNDVFYANREGIELFHRGQPLRGDITGRVTLWDAGTEINQEPGVGPDQAPRQAAPNTGAAENGVVRPLNDGFRYPAVTDVLRITVTPVTGGRMTM